MKTLSTIFVATGLAFGTITAMSAPASAEYYSDYGSYGSYGFFGVPGGYPDLTYIFRPHSIYRGHYYDASPHVYRTDGYAGGHVQRCLARYRTYNPATDLYFKHPGVTARCGL